MWTFDVPTESILKFKNGTFPLQAEYYAKILQIHLNTMFSAQK